MADTKEFKDNLLVDFDERLREVEISHSSLSTTIVSMNTNITEMKQMFQKFLVDSERITEIAGKIESIQRLERDTHALTIKYDDLYKRYIMTEHMCNSCSITKVNDYIKDVSDKVNKIEVSISEMKESKGKLNGFWGSIAQSIVTVVLLYLLYIVATSIQINGNVIANPPDIKKSEISFVGTADAETFKNISTIKRK